MVVHARYGRALMKVDLILLLNSLLSATSARENFAELQNVLKINSPHLKQEWRQDFKRSFSATSAAGVLLLFPAANYSATAFDLPFGSLPMRV